METGSAIWINKCTNKTKKKCLTNSNKLTFLYLFLGVFLVKLTEDRDCAIYLNTSSLDYETLSEYSLEVQLESIQGLINPDRSKATIRVHVTDANDNAPVFVINEQSGIQVRPDITVILIISYLILIFSLARYSDDLIKLLDRNFTKATSAACTNPKTVNTLLPRTTLHVACRRIYARSCGSADLHHCAGF